MSEDFTPWPAEPAERYRQAGYWQGQTFGDWLRDLAERHGDRTALVAGAERLSYAELDARTDRLARRMRGLGVVAGDRVVVQFPNRAAFLPAVLALFRIGALPVFALPAHRRVEIGHLLTLTGASTYLIADRFAGFDYRRLARELVEQIPGLRRVLVDGDPEEFEALETVDDAATVDDASTADGATGTSGANGRTDVHSSPTADQVAFLNLSGGSTGLPKLIPRTHDDYLYSVRASAGICGLSESSVYLCVLPVAHNFSLSSPGVLGVLHAGGRVILSETSDPAFCFELIEAEQVTITALVPPLAKLWLDVAAARRPQLDSLEVLQVGGARLSDEIAGRVAPTLGCRLQQVFGMAEGLVNYTRFDDPDDVVTGTQGRPISPDDEIRVVDDDDQDLPDGQLGHLLTRGPYTIRGYYRAAEHNRKAFTADGFYRTGDLVRRRPFGHLVVEGRAKDQINRGGEKVAVEEVENHLLAHPDIFDVAVVAVPDPVLGERSCAIVVPRGQAPSVGQVRAFVRSRGLAEFKVPDQVRFVDAFPTTGVGKISKVDLRRLLTEQLAAAVPD